MSFTLENLCKDLQAIDIDENDADQMQALNRLIDSVHEKKQPDHFIRVYQVANLAIDSSYDKDNLIPLGLFKKLQTYLDALLLSTSITAAVEQARAINLLMPDVMQLGEE